MYTLSIPEIFQNLASYQADYLSILAHPDQYFIPVKDAFIDVWPLGRIELCLGDLLQLWFSQKWLIQPAEKNLVELEFGLNTEVIEHADDVYLYQITGSSLTGKNHSKAWSLSQQKQLEVSVGSVLRHVVEFKALSRVKVAHVLNYSS